MSPAASLAQPAGLKNKSAWHWITVALTCGLAATSIGICSNSVGVFFLPASAELGVGKGTFALHATLTNLFIGFFALLVVPFLRRYNFRALVSAGILLAGGSTLLMAAADQMWMFYLLGALRGIGCAFFSGVIITYVITNWFEQRHGFAVGITLSFSGLAGALFSPMFSYIIGLWGWRNGFLVMGVLIIALALPGVLLVLEPSPARRGLLPYGAKSAAQQRPQPAAVVQPAAPHKVRLPAGALAGLAVFGLLAGASTAITQFFPAYAESVHSTAMVGALMVSAAMIGNITSKLVIGLLSDKIGAIYASMIMICAAAAALTALCLIQPGWIELLTYAIALVFGSVYAVGAVSTSLVTRQVAGAADYAAVFPYVALFGNLGYAIFMSVVGFVYDLVGSYQVSMLAAVGFAGIMLLLLWGLRAWLARTPAGRLAATVRAGR